MLFKPPLKYASDELGVTLAPPVYLAYKVVKEESTTVLDCTLVVNDASLYHPSKVLPVFTGGARVPICSPIVPLIYCSS